MRLRIGVGRSDTGRGVTDHVLGRFSDEEAGVLDTIISQARDAVLTILTEGSKVSMNRFNTKI